MRPFSCSALRARIVLGPGAARMGLPLIASTRDAELVRELVAPFAGRVAATFTDVKEHVPAFNAPGAPDAAARVARAAWEGGPA